MKVKLMMMPYETLWTPAIRKHQFQSSDTFVYWMKRCTQYYAIAVIKLVLSSNIDLMLRFVKINIASLPSLRMGRAHAKKQ